MSSAVVCVGIGSEVVVGLAGDIALEAAEDFASVESVGGAFGGVRACGLAVPEPADGDHVERPVGLSVAAEVESVAFRAARACLDRGGAADLRERGFVSEPLDVLPRGDEELACMWGAKIRLLPANRPISRGAHRILAPHRPTLARGGGRYQA